MTIAGEGRNCEIDFLETVPNSHEMMPILPKPGTLSVSPALLKPVQRPFSHSALPPLPPPTGFARLTSRRVIALAGKGAPHFLQGLTTRNIAPRHTWHDQDQYDGFYSAFLNAEGRVLHDVFIYPGAHHNYFPKFSSSRGPLYHRSKSDDPGFLIDVDANVAEMLSRHLKKFRLRAKVEVKILDEHADVWSLWHQEYSLPQFLSQTTKYNRGKISCAMDARAHGVGVRVVLPHGKKPEIEAEESSLESYHLRRILNGVAEGQDEILHGHALPLESNMDYMGGIDFRKGCYLGQELTIRTHHRGVVRKRILPVQLYSQGQPPEHLQYDSRTLVAMPPSGTDIKWPNGEGRSIGKWLGGVGNIGLALCRLECMTDIKLTGESNLWRPEFQFALSWAEWESKAAGEARVKAFVPDWLEQSRREINA